MSWTLSASLTSTSRSSAFLTSYTLSSSDSSSEDSLWQNCSADSSHSDLIERLYIEKAGSPVTFFLTWRKGGRVLAISSSFRVVQVSRRMRPWHRMWHGAL